MTLKLKRVEKEVESKPKLKKLAPVKKKPTVLKRVVKTKTAVLPFNNNYTGEWRGNFPWKPEMTGLPRRTE